MSDLQLKFLTQNTAMIGRKRRGKRPGEWANYIEKNFDLACLQEVWTNRTVRRLRRKFDDAPSMHDKNTATMIRSSGLTSLVWNEKIVRKSWHRYRRQAGWDRFARKGVILTEISLGIGSSTLQVYNTHLNAARANRDRTNYVEERLITVRQLFELGRFIAKTKKPESPAIVCGDLNLDGEAESLFPVDLILGYEGASRDRIRRGLKDKFWRNVANGQGEALKKSLTNEVPADYSTRRSFGLSVTEKTQYQIIRDMFIVLGFRDAWGENNINNCYTTKLGPRDNEHFSKWRLRQAVMANPDPKSENVFATDSIFVAPSAKRLDYLFFSSGNGCGGCTLNISDVRRTYIPRPDQEGIPAYNLKWMSDHVGLACQLNFTAT